MQLLQIARNAVCQFVNKELSIDTWQLGLLDIDKKFDVDNCQIFKAWVPQPVI